MTGLDISPWTLASWGIAWCLVSSVLALALGRVLRRTNAAAEAEQSHLEALHSTPADLADVDPWLSQAGVEDEEEDEDYGSRATSGTRFRAVQVDDEQQPAQKIRRIG